MIITFCGHSNIKLNEIEKLLLKKILIEEIKKDPLTKFYLGGYGNFDNLCLQILREIKIDFNNIEILFITPYINADYYKFKFAKEYYDDVIFPPLENTPYRLAIIKRNEWMINSANLVISYVKHSWGGAAKTLEYAKKKEG